ncbi:MAG: ABC transporter permease [Coriobacteriia bacterium]|nr:ABC transporter permease [Coriobacteriia bacterium]
MSLARMLKVLRKDFALGPRSPVFLYMIILPFALTALFQFAFGSLFTPQPRLGIVDEGTSAITAAIREMDGIELTVLEDAEELRTQVEANDLDAGLILSAGFDEAVRDGEQPPLQFYIGGESYASNRIILTVTALDVIRDLEGSEAPVEVEVVSFGEAGLPINLRLVPIIVFYALAMAGIFVPGSSLVEEKEQGTLMALLVTPVKASEVLVSKWAFGVVLATVMSGVTLALNGALGPRPLDVLVVLVVGAVLVATLGLLIGVVAKDSTMLFALIKGTGVLMFAPAIFYLFPDWPQWIAKLFPLYWVIEPIWRVSVMGGAISEVWFELGVALAISAVMLPLIVWLARRMQAQMAAQ